MRVALVQCPCYDINGPPMGVAYLATYLKKNGYEVNVFDFNIDIYREVKGKYKNSWNPNNSDYWSHDELFPKLEFISDEMIERCAMKLINSKARIIGFSIQSTSAIFSMKVAEKIKKIDKSKLIVFGGPLCYKKTGYYKEKTKSTRKIVLEHNMEDYCDIIVIGEGEDTLLDIVNQIGKKGKISNCPGTLIKKGEELIDYSLREQIKDIDEIPFPDYEDFDLNKYENYVHRKELRILGSRGCVNKCVFCTDTIQWRGYRYRSAENIVKEIEFLKNKYGATFFVFNDSVLNGNLNNLVKMAELLHEKKLGISWAGYMRIDPKMDFTAFDKIRKSGCEFIEFGIESGSQRVLDRMNKRIKIKDAHKVLKNSHKAGNLKMRLGDIKRSIKEFIKQKRYGKQDIKQLWHVIVNCRPLKIRTNWIIGFPSEKRIDFIKTLWFIIMNRFYIKHINMSMFYINPLSIIESYPEKFNVRYDKFKSWETLDGKNTLKERQLRTKIMTVFVYLLLYKRGIKTVQRKRVIG